MSTLSIQIENFSNLISSTEFDIIHEEFLFTNEEISKSSIVNLNFNERVIKVRFDLGIDSEITEDNFLFVAETDILFYKGYKEWCAFDLINLKRIRQEEALYLPFIEKREEIILIYCDLSVESMDLHAVRIDQVPVDPPYEAIEFEDRIEFDSSIYGKQVLKTQKSL